MSERKENREGSRHGLHFLLHSSNFFADPLFTHSSRAQIKKALALFDTNKVIGTLSVRMG